jgi:transposase
MKTLITEDKAVISALAERLKQAKGRPEFQRIQCVLIRATLGCSAPEIAQLLGWSPATVHVIHSRWAKEGESIFDLKPKGGRRRQYLTPEEEEDFLRPFVAKAGAGGVLNAMEIKAAFEARVGKTVAKTTIYRLLDRSGWRKVIPRPQHPKSDSAAQAAFKKTRNGARRRG